MFRAPAKQYMNVLTEVIIEAVINSTVCSTCSVYMCMRAHVTERW